MLTLSKLITASTGGILRLRLNFKQCQNYLLLKLTFYCQWRLPFEYILIRMEKKEKSIFRLLYFARAKSNLKFSIAEQCAIIRCSVFTILDVISWFENESVLTRNDRYYCLLKRVAFKRVSRTPKRTEHFLKLFSTGLHARFTVENRIAPVTLFASLTRTNYNNKLFTDKY